MLLTSEEVKFCHFYILNGRKSRHPPLQNNTNQEEGKNHNIKDRLRRTHSPIRQNRKDQIEQPKAQNKPHQISRFYRMIL